MGLELIAHLDCGVRRRARGAHAKEECGNSLFWCGYYLVTTRDVLSFVLRRQIRIKASPGVCLFLVDTV